MLLGDNFYILNDCVLWSWQRVWNIPFECKWSSMNYVSSPLCRWRKMVDHVISTKKMFPSRKICSKYIGAIFPAHISVASAVIRLSPELHWNYISVLIVCVRVCVRMLVCVRLRVEMKLSPQQAPPPRGAAHQWSRSWGGTMEIRCAGNR